MCTVWTMGMRCGFQLARMHPRHGHKGEASWIDQGNVYSLREDVFGWYVDFLLSPKMDCRSSRHGSFFGAAMSRWCTRAVPCMISPIDLQTACFRSDGAQMLCVSEVGLVTSTLRRAVIDHKSGFLVPAGFREHPMCSTRTRGSSSGSVVPQYAEILPLRPRSMGTSCMVQGVPLEHPDGGEYLERVPLCGIFLVGHDGGVFRSMTASLDTTFPASK